MQIKTSIFHQTHPEEFTCTRVSFVCKECADMKSGLSADYVLRHMARISFLVFIILCVHIYLLISGYITDWILSSALEATHTSAGERLPHVSFTCLMQVSLKLRNHQLLLRTSWCLLELLEPDWGPLTAVANLQHVLPAMVSLLSCRQLKHIRKDWRFL